MILKKFKDYLLRPTKFDNIDKYLRKKGIKILDVGCGNNACLLLKKYYPNNEYHGIDRTKKYNNVEKNFKLMKKFYNIDLSKGDLSKIKDNYFDIIIFSHVIEHIKNGEDILIQLSKKLKKGGIIYIETPSPHTKKMPAPKGGILNFYQDKTHIRVYPVSFLNKFLKKINFRILKSGLKISPKRIVFSPLYFLIPLFKGKFSWEIVADITGFASYIVAQKK